VALFLKKHGIEGVYPLAGGMAAWLTLGYPTAVVALDD
jgi:rhodanese-related sulfurtransferase